MLKYLDISGLSYFYTKISNKFTKVKIDTSENLNSDLTFVPEMGEIVVYSDYAEKTVNGTTTAIPNIKIGDGLAYCVDLPFVNDDIRDAIMSHINDQNRHITQQERDFWNDKVTVDESGTYLINNECLVFKKD